MTTRIGIDLGGTKISGVVLDEAGQELTRSRVQSPRSDYRGTLTAVARLVAELESAAGLKAGAATVGIGTPGTWQARLGRMKNCNSTWLNDQPLLPDLQALLGARVRVANDADCLALSEARDGAGAGAETVFGVILGTGVGGALVVAERLLQGPNGLSGEWGHLPLPYYRQHVFAGDSAAEAGRFQLELRLQDRPCYCGRLNCIEAFLSGPGLEATHTELWDHPATAEQIAAGDDEQRDATWQVYQHMLARSLAQVVNLFDPGVIVLGGGVSNAERLYPALESMIPAFAFTSVRETDGAPVEDVKVSVRAAQWGDDSGVRGAARLWDGV